MAHKLNDLEIQKRQTLKSVLDHVLFKQAIDDIRQDYGQEVLKSNDPVARDRLIAEAHVLTRVENQLESYVNDLLFLEQKKREDEAA